MADSALCYSTNHLSVPANSWYSNQGTRVAHLNILGFQLLYYFKINIEDKATTLCGKEKVVEEVEFDWLNKLHFIFVQIRNAAINFSIL